jgi:hypothetical protein
VAILRELVEDHLASDIRIDMDLVRVHHRADVSLHAAGLRRHSTVSEPAECALTACCANRTCSDLLELAYLHAIVRHTLRGAKRDLLPKQRHV